MQVRFNKIGACLSAPIKGKLLKLMGHHFADLAVKAVKKGKVLRATGDNWDLNQELGHMRQGLKNPSMHLFSTNLYVNRVDFRHMLNEGPKRDILTSLRSIFTPSATEYRVLKDAFKIFVGRICLEFFPHFKLIKKMVPKHIRHQFSDAMNTKSTIITCPILPYNQSSYKDCVEILKVYEDWVYEIYKKAGKVGERQEPENPPLPDRVPDPDQPLAHTINDGDGDPMGKINVSVGGDQLARVRLAGAADLRAGAHTATDRFDHLRPFKVAMFHTKASFLQYAYGEHFNNQSVNEPGTLKYFCERYDRKNVTPGKVIDSYEGSEELYESVGRAYIVVALMKFFGMETVEDMPTKNFVGNGEKPSAEEAKSFFSQKFEEFIDKMFFQRGYGGQNDDYVENYALSVIFCTFILLELNDTAAEGDGERNLINQKVLLTIFKSLGAYSKYAIEMFVSIAQMECMLSEKLSNEVKWGFFSNWRGGAGNNIEDDKAQEICNRLSKQAVMRMGANKTIENIQTVSRATSGLKMVIENFDKISSTHHVSSKHTTRSSKDDELSMVNDLMQLKPFDHEDGRCFRNFPMIQRCPTKYLDIAEFHCWLDRHKKQIGSGNL